MEKLSSLRTAGDWDRRNRVRIDSDRSGNRNKRCATSLTTAVLTRDSCRMGFAPAERSSLSTLSKIISARPSTSQDRLNVDFDGKWTKE